MQSRLTSIAGSRDDLSAAKYDAFQSEESLRYWREQVSAPPMRSFTDAPTARVGATVDDDLAIVVERRADRGLGRILWVDLSSPDLDLAFARTLVPGLEGTIASPSYVPGPRARAKMGS
jgi:ribosomal protein S12 methylthiotransferase accessory factor